MRQATDALRAASSYHVSGMLDTGFVVDVVVLPDAASGSVTSHGVTWRFVEVHGRLWLRGAALWRATVARAAAARLGDDWVSVRDPKAAYGWAGRLSHLPAGIPDLVFVAKPGLVNRGVRTVGGHRVIELSSKNDVYDVLTSNPPYPIRWLEPDERGPNGQPCGIELDRFDAVVNVTAPARWVVG